MRKAFISILAAALLLIASCSSPQGSLPSPSEQATTPSNQSGANPSGSEDPNTTGIEGGDTVNNPIVTIEMDSGAKIVVELYPDKAPNTVNNFISLINDGYYDGVIFHRVIPGFMIQGGDPDGTGSGGPGYQIPGEFANNGFVQNDIAHVRGVISMARQGSQTNPASAYNTAGSQFFIMVDTATHLDSDYAAFGMVTDGMDEVDRIVALDKNMNNKPYDPPVMSKVTVETFGKTYDEPEKST